MKLRNIFCKVPHSPSNNPTLFNHYQNFGTLRAWSISMELITLDCITLNLAITLESYGLVLENNTPFLLPLLPAVVLDRDI